MQYLDHRELKSGVAITSRVISTIIVVVLATPVIAAVIEVAHNLHCVLQVTANRVRAQRFAQMKRLNQHQTAISRLCQFHQSQQMAADFAARIGNCSHVHADKSCC